MITKIVIIKYSIVIPYKTYCVQTKSLAGVQPEIFQGSGDFLELGHLDKHFVKNTLEFFPQILLKLHFK